jgi:hypothetical protein
MILLQLYLDFSFLSLGREHMNMAMFERLLILTPIMFKHPGRYPDVPVFVQDGKVPTGSGGHSVSIDPIHDHDNLVCRVKHCEIHGSAYPEVACPDNSVSDIFPFDIGGIIRNILTLWTSMACSKKIVYAMSIEKTNALIFI